MGEGGLGGKIQIVFDHLGRLYLITWDLICYHGKAISKKCLPKKLRRIIIFE